MKSPAFYVPANLDPRTIPRGQRQYAACFLNLLHWKRVCWQADDEGFIRLKRDYLTRIIPCEVWLGLRDWLWAKHVILYDQFWTPGKRSKGYALAPEYRRTRRIECTNAELAKRIEVVYRSERGAHLPVHKWLAEKLDLLSFDLERARRIISTMVPDEESKMPVDEYRQLLLESCKRIFNGDHWLHCDRFGRVHTPITSLAKKLRCCLNVDGRHLVGLDLANSQPLIAGLVARQFHSSRNRAMRLRKRVFRKGANPYRNRRMEKTEPNPRHPDLEQYLKLCESGQLYESLMKSGDSRERVKRGFLTAMYGKNNWRDKTKDALERLCPSVAEMLKKLKERDHRRAAHLLQNAEATLFIDCIARRIQSENPDLPIYTIHDSIFTIPEGLEPVRGIIMEEFERLGVRPAMKEENLK